MKKLNIATPSSKICDIASFTRPGYELDDHRRRCPQFTTIWQIIKSIPSRKREGKGRRRKG
jgi:hypothetical protein